MADPGKTEELKGAAKKKMKKQMKKAKKTILVMKKTENEKKTSDRIGSWAACENQLTDWNSQRSCLNKPERHANGEVPESERSEQWMSGWPKGYLENPKWPTGSSENWRMAAGA